MRMWGVVIAHGGRPQIEQQLRSQIVHWHTLDEQRNVPIDPHKQRERNGVPPPPPHTHTHTNTNSQSTSLRTHTLSVRTPPPPHPPCLVGTGSLPLPSCTPAACGCATSQTHCTEGGHPSSCAGSMRTSRTSLPRARGVCVWEGVDRAGKTKGIVSKCCKNPAVGNGHKGTRMENAKPGASWERLPLHASQRMLESAANKSPEYLAQDAHACTEYKFHRHRWCSQAYLCFSEKSTEPPQQPSTCSHTTYRWAIAESFSKSSNAPCSRIGEETYV